MYSMMLLCYKALHVVDEKRVFTGRSIGARHKNRDSYDRLGVSLKEHKMLKIAESIALC